MQVAKKNRLSRACQTVQANIKAQLEEIDNRIEVLNQQIQALAQQQGDWQRKDELLQLAKDIGKVTSALCWVQLS